MLVHAAYDEFFFGNLSDEWSRLCGKKRKKLQIVSRGNLLIWVNFFIIRSLCEYTIVLVYSGWLIYLCAFVFFMTSALLVIRRRIRFSYLTIVEYYFEWCFNFKCTFARFQIRWKKQFLMALGCLPNTMLEVKWNRA